MTISDICKKAREEGWRFTHTGGIIFAKTPHNNMIFKIAGLNSYQLGAVNLDADQLGHAIAAAMNGGKDEVQE